jgi:hypothetical protein
MLVNAFFEMAARTIDGCRGQQPTAHRETLGYEFVANAPRLGCVDISHRGGGGGKREACEDRACAERGDERQKRSTLECGGRQV